MITRSIASTPFGCCISYDYTQLNCLIRFPFLLICFSVKKRINTNGVHGKGGRGEGILVMVCIFIQIYSTIVLILQVQN